MKPVKPEIDENDYKEIKAETSKIKYNREKNIPFGDVRYPQYKDKALGLYSSKDTNDTERRKAYRARHAKEVPSFKKYYSAGYFAYKYLW